MHGDMQPLLSRKNITPEMRTLPLIRTLCTYGPSYKTIHPPLPEMRTSGLPPLSVLKGRPDLT